MDCFDFLVSVRLLSLQSATRIGVLCHPRTAMVLEPTILICHPDRPSRAVSASLVALAYICTFGGTFRRTLRLLLGLTMLPAPFVSFLVFAADEA